MTTGNASYAMHATERGTAQGKKEAQHGIFFRVDKVEKEIRLIIHPQSGIPRGIGQQSKESRSFVSSFVYRHRPFCNEAFAHPSVRNVGIEKKSKSRAWWVSQRSKHQNHIASGRKCAMGSPVEHVQVDTRCQSRECEWLMQHSFFSTF